MPERKVWNRNAEDPLWQGNLKWFMLKWFTGQLEATHKCYSRFSMHPWNSKLRDLTTVTWLIYTFSHHYLTLAMVSPAQANTNTGKNWTPRSRCLIATQISSSRNIYLHQHQLATHAPFITWPVIATIFLHHHHLPLSADMTVMHQCLNHNRKLIAMAIVLKPCVSTFVSKSTLSPLTSLLDLVHFFQNFISL